MLKELAAQEKEKLYRESYDNFETLNGPFAKFIPAIKEKLEHHYEENYEIRPFYQYDVTESPEGATNVSLYSSGGEIILRFPEITITNSHQNTHIIKDLFVKFSITFSGNYYSVQEIKGTRSTLSYSEYTSNYRHSHLSSSVRALEWSSFCTGEGPINNIKAMLGGLIDSFDINLFEHYLIHIKEYVEWESLEGGTYIRMEEIGLTGVTLDYSYPDYYLKGVSKTIRKNFKSVTSIAPINWKFNLHSLYEIVDNIKFERFLYICLRELEGTVFYMKNSSGEYCNRRVNENKSFQDNSKKLLFRGQDFPFTIIDDYEVKKDNEIDLFVHPKIKKYVKSELEYHQNYSSIRKAVIQRNS